MKLLGLGDLSLGNEAGGRKFNWRVCAVRMDSALYSCIAVLLLEF